LLLAILAGGCGGDGANRDRRGSASAAPDEELPGFSTDSPDETVATDDGGEGRSGSSSSGGRSSARVAAGRPGLPTPVPVAKVGPRAASEDRTGVTKTTIRIGHHWPKSSHYGAILKTYIEHFNLYFTGRDGLNERGGVGGRKIELVEADDKLSPSGAATAAKELEEKKVYMVYGHAGVEQQIVVRDAFEKTGLPYVANGLMSTHVKNARTSFTFLTPWDLVAESAPSFIDKVMKLGGRKVGVIWEQPDWPLPKDRFLAEAKRHGLDVAIVEPVTATQASYVQNVSKVRDAEAEVVVMISRLSAPGILRDARAIGYRPAWTGFGPWTLNLFNTASGGLMEGIKAVRQWQGVDAPKYAEYAEHMQANGSEPNEEGFGGWMIGFFLEHVLARAGADPTRPSFVEGLQKTDGSPINLGVTPPVRYAPGRHWQSEEALPVEVKDGNFRRIGDWKRRF
jgi:ABC-type branched-subunit amino acid transport system substrate-binding protein